MKNKMEKELFEYLDGYEFVEFAEVVAAVEEYYTKVNKDESTSWGELAQYGILAEDYCIDKGILGFDELGELMEKKSDLEEFSYSYDEGDNYVRACELCDKDPRENGDFTDEEMLIEEVKRRAEDGDLQGIKWMLEDIDLDNTYFMYDGNGWPRNIERSDSEYVIEDKIKEIDAEIENLRERLE